jgi:hypothetical protein
MTGDPLEAFDEAGEIVELVSSRLAHWR